MEPTSVWLIVLPVLAAIGLLVVMCRWRNIVLRLFAGLFALVLATATGVALVNDYYGYYQTWSALKTDFGGSTSDIGHPIPPGSTPAPATGTSVTGRLDRVVITGAGISRTDYVYLPPGYGAPGVRLPVVEFFHGSPGRPTDYLHLHLLQDLDTAVAEHHIGPMVLVLPAINPKSGFEDCVNGPKGQDATYLSQVVPAYVRAHFAVSPDPQQWGLAGYSSGGYCAANLGVQQAATIGAVAVMDGYFRPQDGPAGAALDFNRHLLALNDPLANVGRLRLGDRVPPTWVAAGTGDSGDFQTAQAYVRELSAVEQVDFEINPGAAHNFYAWNTQLPSALNWLWPQLATPQLRLRYPTIGTTVTQRSLHRGSW